MLLLYKRLFEDIQSVKHEIFEPGQLKSHHFSLPYYSRYYTPLSVEVAKELLNQGRINVLERPSQSP